MSTKKVSIKIDPFMTSQLFKDHPGLGFTNNYGEYIYFENADDFANYVLKDGNTSYMYVPEDEAIAHQYPIIDDVNNPSMIRIGQMNDKNIVYNNYINQLIKQYPSIKNEKEARALHSYLLRFENNLNDFFKYNYKQGGNDIADKLYNQLVFDQSQILRMMGKNPSDAVDIVNKSLADKEFNRYETFRSASLTGDASELPNDYKLVPTVVSTGYGGLTHGNKVIDNYGNIVYNPTVDPNNTINTQDPADNGLNNLMAVGAGAIRAPQLVFNVGKNIINGTKNIGKHAINAMTFSTYTKPGTVLGNLALRKGLGDFAFKAGLWGDLAINTAFGARVINNYRKNPNPINASFIGLSLLPAALGAKDMFMSSATGMTLKALPEVFKPYGTTLLKQVPKHPYGAIKTTYNIAKSMRNDVLTHGKQAVINNQTGWLRPYQDQVENGIQGSNDLNYIKENELDYDLSNYIGKYFNHELKSVKPSTTQFTYEDKPVMEYTNPSNETYNIYTSKNDPLVDIAFDKKGDFGKMVLYTQDGTRSFGTHVGEGVDAFQQRQAYDFINNLPSGTYFGGTSTPTTGQVAYNILKSFGKTPSVFKLIDASKMQPTFTTSHLDQYGMYISPFSPHSLSWINRMSNKPGFQPRYVNTYMQYLNNHAKESTGLQTLNGENMTKLPINEQLDLINKKLVGRKAFIGLDKQLHIPIVEGFKK